MDLIHSGKPQRTYTIAVRMGECMVCHKTHDLRCGVCFSCADQVDGEPIPHGHRLWERGNPENTWYVGN